MALANESADLDAVCKAVTAALRTISGIGEVEDRPGGAPTWLRRQGGFNPYWEVDVTAATETLTSTSTSTEYIYIAVEGYLPFKFAEPGSSAPYFRNLIKAIKAKLRSDEDLGGVVDRSELPQCVANDYVTFTEQEKSDRCHHCRIEIQYQRDFSFDP